MFEHVVLGECASNNSSTSVYLPYTTTLSVWACTACRTTMVSASSCGGGKPLKNCWNTASYPPGKNLPVPTTNVLFNARWIRSFDRKLAQLRSKGTRRPTMALLIGWILLVLSRFDWFSSISIKYYNNYFIRLSKVYHSFWECITKIT